MKHIVLCSGCGVYPALDTHGEVRELLCMQCRYGAGKATDGEKPLTRTAQAHVLLSKAVANGTVDGLAAKKFWQQWLDRPKAKFVPRRKPETETEDEKRARLALIAEETRKLYPEQFTH